MVDIRGLAIALRPVHESDLDALFDQMRDPESVRMAAFTPEDPDVRQRFDGHIAKLLASPEVTLWAVTCNEDLVGSIASFVVEERTEVTYWIDRAVWGRGLASRAVALFLEVVRERPLYAQAASDNAASLRVLEKAGFRVIDTEVSLHRRAESISKRRSCGLTSSPRRELSSRRPSRRSCGAGQQAWPETTT